jgi:hypothetical protein
MSRSHDGSAAVGKHPRRRSVSLVFGLVLTAAILITLVVGIAIRFWIDSDRQPPSPEEAVSARIDTLCKAIEAGQFGQTYDTLTAPRLRKLTSKEDYGRYGAAIGEQFGALVSKQQIAFENDSVAGEPFVNVAYDATFAKGPGRIVATLKQVQSEWLIQLFQVTPIEAKPAETEKKTEKK